MIPMEEYVKYKSYDITEKIAVLIVQIGVVQTAYTSPQR
jgi:hypothetical protein